MGSSRQSESCVCVCVRSDERVNTGLVTDAGQGLTYQLSSVHHETLVCLCSRNRPCHFPCRCSTKKNEIPISLLQPQVRASRVGMIVPEALYDRYRSFFSKNKIIKKNKRTINQPQFVFCSTPVINSYWYNSWHSNQAAMMASSRYEGNLEEKLKSHLLQRVPRTLAIITTKTTTIIIVMMMMISSSL